MLNMVRLVPFHGHSDLLTDGSSESLVKLCYFLDGVLVYDSFLNLEHMGYVQT